MAVVTALSDSVLPSIISLPVFLVHTVFSLKSPSVPNLISLNVPDMERISEAGSKQQQGKSHNTHGKAYSVPSSAL